MDIKDIQNLIRFVAKSGATEVELETGDIKIKIKTLGQEGDVQATYMVPAPAPVAVAAPAPAAAPVAAAPAAPAAESASDESRLITIKSPMIGTFYRRPGPDKPNFLNVGDSVKVGQVVCIIEAMKLFNEIESEVSGKVVKMLVEDSMPVEYDQPLFLIDPA
jgi:acetyl-CoA carboxylase biotin carboxyl carrier protein